MSHCSGGRLKEAVVDAQNSVYLELYKFMRIYNGAVSFDPKIGERYSHTGRVDAQKRNLNSLIAMATGKNVGKYVKFYLQHKTQIHMTVHDQVYPPKR